MGKIEYLVYVLVNYHVNWTLLPKDLRYLGYRRDWYDGPIYCVGFWWGHIYAMDKMWFEDEDED